MYKRSSHKVIKWQSTYYKDNKKVVPILTSASHVIGLCINYQNNWFMTQHRANIYHQRFYFDIQLRASTAWGIISDTQMIYHE